MVELRRRGKRLVVLTNAASYTRAAALEKYHRLGFDFTRGRGRLRRDVAVARLESIAPGAVWAAISAAGDTFADMPARVVDDRRTGLSTAADAVLFLSPPAGPTLQAALEQRCAASPARWWSPTPTLSPRAKTA